MSSHFQPEAADKLKSGPGLAGLGLNLGDFVEWLKPLAAEPADPLAVRDGKVAIKAVTVDSRLVAEGSVFVALKGENRDGHDFVRTAFEKGAVAAVVGSEWRRRAALGKNFENLSPRLMVVNDPVKALGRLARSVRDRTGAKVAAVTGSVGKTTVKELLRSIFSSYLSEDELTATYGNFNNEIGLPLTLLSFGSGTKMGVVEMGASHFGEIAELTAIARPDVGLVTAAGEAHLEAFGSAAGAARAKGELYAGLETDASAVINADDENLRAMGAAFAGRKIYFGFSGGKTSELSVTVKEIGERSLSGQKVVLVSPLFKSGSLTASMKLLGRHNAVNAAAAAAAALAAGAPEEAVADGLSLASPFPGRLKACRSRKGFWIMDDCYNANPTSTEAALKFLADLPPRFVKAAVLGDMLELGGGSQASHYRLGRTAGEAGLRYLALVGDLAGETLKGARAGGLSAEDSAAVASPEEAAGFIFEKVGRLVPEEVVILVKGSRGIGLEKTVVELERLL